MRSFTRCLGPLAASLSLNSQISASVIRQSAPEPWSNFNNNPIFYPDQAYTSWRVLYPRTLQLPDESILLSWEDYDNTVDRAYAPVYKSEDGGVTFSSFTRVEDQVNGWGLAYQPFFYRLPQDIGQYTAGTILLATTSVPRDLSQAYIDVYSSTDDGLTWAFVSHVVYGPGPETTTNGDKAVWEAFLEIYDGQLVCHYSTQVDENYAQKLVHKTTTDLINWSEEGDDVAQPRYEDRPGMTVVAEIQSTGQWIMTFEYCNAPGAEGCPAYYKVADSPLEFGSVEPQPLKSNGSSQLWPNGSPYVIWTPHPDRSDGSGLIIASGNGVEELLVNEDSANPNGWKAVDVGQWAAHSRSLEIISHGGEQKLLLGNAGNMGCSGDCYNYVADGVVDIPT